MQTNTLIVICTVFIAIMIAAAVKDVRKEVRRIIDEISARRGQ